MFKVAAALGVLAVLGGAVLLDSRRSRATAPQPTLPSSSSVGAGARPSSAPGHPAAPPPPPATGASEDLEALLQQDPELALGRISARTPSSEHEAQWLKVMEVRALVALGRVGSARARAAEYYSRWPDGPDVTLLGRLTGRHPTPRR